MVIANIGNLETVNAADIAALPADAMAGATADDFANMPADAMGGMSADMITL